MKIDCVKIIFDLLYAFQWCDVISWVTGWVSSVQNVLLEQFLEVHFWQPSPSDKKYFWRNWPFEQKPKIVEVVFGSLLKLSENPIVKVLLMYCLVFFWFVLI